jgi:hypothetical protein
MYQMPATDTTPEYSFSATHRHTAKLQPTRQGATPQAATKGHFVTAVRLKVLLALAKREEAHALQQELESLGHRVQICREVDEALRFLIKWPPDLIITDEQLDRAQPFAGLRLAEYCRVAEDQINGWKGARTVILIPVADWDRFKRAQDTGAHVVLKKSFDAVVRYVQTIADNLVTDRVLGPVLVGVHKFKGDMPTPNCKNCEWVGATVSYGSSETDVAHLTPVRTALLNILLFRRRGLSPSAIVARARETFFKRILKQHELRESAVKMEITRLRQDIGKALEWIGIPYSGAHFLPLLPYDVKTYGLSGNRRLIHVPSGNIELRAGTS